MTRPHSKRMNPEVSERFERLKEKKETELGIKLTVSQFTTIILDVYEPRDD